MAFKSHRAYHCGVANPRIDIPKGPAENRGWFTVVRTTAMPRSLPESEQIRPVLIDENI